MSAVVVVATPGASNANSFQTVSEIDAYYEGRVPEAIADEWRDADAANKAAAAVTATLWITSLIVWTGYETSLTQALPWPREGMWKRNGREYVPNDEIPQELKNAHAELSRVFLSTDRMAESDVAVQGITAVRVGSIRVAFKDDADPTPVIPTILSQLLVPSWVDYIRDQQYMERELRRA